MSSRYLLDTSAAIAHINNDPTIEQLFAEADELFLPSIALGELYFGAENSGRVEANIAQIEKFASEIEPLDCNRGTARWYGRIEYGLRVKGRPIPQNDMWITAIALQHSLTVLTRDVHFNDVDGLAVQGW